MKLQLVPESTSKLGFITFCCKCDKRLSSLKDKIFADLDGKSFTDYYCEICKKEMK